MQMFKRQCIVKNIPSRDSDFIERPKKSKETILTQITRSSTYLNSTQTIFMSPHTFFTDKNARTYFFMGRVMVLS